MTPIPQSVYDRAELLARSHPLGVVAQLIGKKPSVVTRMKQRGWKARDYSVKIRPIPNDFTIQARHMSQPELCTHYRAGTQTIVKWMAETNPRPSMRGKRRKGRE